MILPIIGISSLVVLAAVIAVVDVRTQKIPYRLSIPPFAIAAGLGSPVDGLLVLVVAMGVSLAMRAFGRPSFGDADAMLIGAAGCLLDWRLAVLAAAIPAVAALCVYRRRPVALGPWIVPGEAFAIMGVALL